MLVGSRPVVLVLSALRWCRGSFVTALHTTIARSALVASTNCHSASRPPEQTTPAAYKAKIIRREEQSRASGIACASLFWHGPQIGVVARSANLALRARFGGMLYQSCTCVVMVAQSCGAKRGATNDRLPECRKATDAMVVGSLGIRVGPPTRSSQTASILSCFGVLCKRDGTAATKHTNYPTTTATTTSREAFVACGLALSGNVC